MSDISINNVSIVGADIMLKNLKKISNTIRGDVALEAVQEGANVIMAKAVMNAPVLTSALRNSFRVESRKIGSGAEAEVGPHVVYGRIQEFGGLTGRGHKVYIKGKFYLSNAIKEKQAEVSRVMAETIQDYLN